MVKQAAGCGGEGREGLSQEVALELCDKNSLVEISGESAPCRGRSRTRGLGK